MANLKTNNKYRIIRYPSECLASVCEEVEDGDTSAIDNFSRFKASCLINKGVAVAAPQLGITLRYFYFRFDNESFMAINPKINSVSEGSESAFEGCLSIPGKVYQIERHTSLNWSYTDQNGARWNEDASGWKARIIQHEIDHLNGICIADK
jgi:peptide deformylase